MINARDLTRPKTAPAETAADKIVSAFVEIVTPNALPAVTLPNVKPNTVTTTVELEGMIEFEILKTNSPSKDDRTE